MKQIRRWDSEYTVWSVIDIKQETASLKNMRIEQTFVTDLVYCEFPIVHQCSTGER